MQSTISIQHFEAIKKMEKFCAYQERCTFDVQQKLISLGIEKSGIPAIINELKEQKFLDDQRFAEIFVRSKFKHNNWGEVKIRAALSQKKIDKEIIAEALKQIVSEDNEDKILQLAKQKFSKLKDEDIWKRKQKTASFLISKGFKQSEVFAVIKLLS